MKLNPELTVTDGRVMFWASLAFLALAVYVTIRAWRSTPETWAAWARRFRPRNWERWPVYGFLWRDQDNRPKYYVWQTRLVGILAILMGLFGVVTGVQIMLR